jgi:HD-like signal output (HDOD) protein
VLQDFALTNKLLKVVNSAGMKDSGRITTVSQAIMKLGLSQVRSLTTAFC